MTWESAEAVLTSERNPDTGFVKDASCGTRGCTHIHTHTHTVREGLYEIPDTGFVKDAPCGTRGCAHTHTHTHTLGKKD